MDELIIFLKYLPEEKWETEVNSNWRIKNVVAHLIAWNHEATREINRFSKEGGQPWYLNSERNYDDFNAKAVEKYMNFSKIELLAELSKSETEVREAIKKCGQKNLENRSGFKWLFDKKDKKSHAAQHLDQIRKALGDKE